MGHFGFPSLLSMDIGLLYVIFCNIEFKFVNVPIKPFFKAAIAVGNVGDRKSLM